MITKVEQYKLEILELKEKIDSMKNAMKPLQQRKTYLQRQLSMIKSRQKVK